MKRTVLRILVLAIAAMGCGTTGGTPPAHRVGASGLAPGMFHVIPVSLDPSVSGLPGAVGDLAQGADGLHAWQRSGPNITDWVSVPTTGGGGASTLSGAAFPQTWESAVLASFQKVNAQLVAQSFPTFDFLENTLAASRTTQVHTGTGSIAQTQSYLGGAAVLSIGSGAGSVSFYPVNSPSINGVSQGVPFAIALHLQIPTVAISSTTLLLPANFFDTSLSERVGVGVNPNAVTINGSPGWVTTGSTTNFVINIAGPGGAYIVVTSFVIPPAGTWFDIGLLEDGGRFIAFYGNALQGTFVPDLVNTLDVLTPFGTGLPALMPAPWFGDSVPTSIIVDKMNAWTGVVN